MVRNTETKMTRKFRKNTQTRKRNLRRRKTKIWRNRTYKMMKGGAVITLETLRLKLDPTKKNVDGTNTLGYEINGYLNRIARFIVCNLKRDENVPLMRNYLKSIEKSVNVSGVNGQVIFIPNRYTRLESDIKGVMTAIQEKYAAIYESMNPGPPQRKCLGFSCQRSDSYRTDTGLKLTPNAFNGLLEFVCSGKIHESIRLSPKIVLKSDNGYLDLLKSLTSLYNIVDPYIPDDFSGYDTTFNPHPTVPQLSIPDFSLPEGWNQQTESSIYQNVSEIYENLCSICSNEPLLDNRQIDCYACIIVMPNFSLRDNSQNKPIRYGYADFSREPIFVWAGLGQEHLEPNRYCAQRTAKRIMKSSITKLHYTMSPLSVLTPDRPIQEIHVNTIGSMKTTINRANDQEEYRTRLQNDWGTDRKIKITYSYSPVSGVVLYCELKMEKKDIKISNGNGINAIVIEFNIFDEDGICSKKLIFVSYAKNVHLVHNPALLPGSVDYDLPSYGIQGNPVSKDKLKNASEMLFRHMFFELTNRLYHIPKDKVILFLKNMDGTFQTRNDSSNATDKSDGLKILDEHDDYNGICTIVLNIRNVGSSKHYIWSVAKATKTQKNAFNAVNGYITNSMTYPPWDKTNGQTKFQLYNGLTGDAEIKVTVKVLTTEDSPKKLISAEYQAESQAEYLLFATTTDAKSYLENQMQPML